MKLFTTSQKILLGFVGVLGFIIIVTVALVLMGEIFPYSSTEFGNWAMWIGAISTLFAAIGTVGTLVYLISDNRYQARVAESMNALKAYKDSIETLISILNATQDNDQKWLVIENTYYRMSESYSGITEKTHINRAKSNYKSLSPYLELFYHRLEQHDFLSLNKNIKLKDSLSANNRSFAASSEILAISWIKHVAGKTPYYINTGYQSYESSGTLKKDYALFLIAFLCTESFAPLDVEYLKSIFSDLKKNKKIESWDISFKIFNEYPLLLAHVLLCETYTASRYKFTNKKSIPTPKLDVLGPDKTWIIVGNNVVKYPHTIFNLDRYLIKKSQDDILTGIGPVVFSR